MIMDHGKSYECFLPDLVPEEEKLLMGHPDSVGSERSYPIERWADLNLKRRRVLTYSKCPSKACTSFAGDGAARLEAAPHQGVSPCSRMNFVTLHIEQRPHLPNRVLRGFIWTYFVACLRQSPPPAPFHNPDPMWQSVGTVILMTISQTRNNTSDAK